MRGDQAEAGRSFGYLDPAAMANGVAGPGNKPGLVRAKMYEDFAAEEGQGRKQPESPGRVSGMATRRVTPLQIPTTISTPSMPRDSRTKAPGSGPTAGRGASPRKQVVETAYWNPAVVTDAEGKARVTLKAPSALSRYEFTARGVTAVDTLAGQAHAEIEVRKDFAVELAAPSTLTEGDRPRFLARLRHRGVEGKATVHLGIVGIGGREVVRRRSSN